MSLKINDEILRLPAFVLESEPACSTVDPELFFPQEIEISNIKVISKYSNLGAAKKICSSCPLRIKCLEYAIKNHEIGVWGGTTESQRDDIRKAGRIKANRRPTPNLW